jgi:hypothetical protein
MAGAKGVGRFSCDRLGKELNIYTKRAGDTSVQHLYINWEEFEREDLNLKIEDIDVPLNTIPIDDFLTRKNLPKFDT